MANRESLTRVYQPTLIFSIPNRFSISVLENQFQTDGEALVVSWQKAPKAQRGPHCGSQAVLYHLVYSSII